MNTTCENILIEISDYLEDSNKLRPSTRSHIRQCQHCSVFLESWEPGGTLSSMASTPLARPTQDSIADQIVAKLPQPTTQPSKFRALLAPLAAAASIAIAIVVWKSQTATPPRTSPAIASTPREVETSPPKPEILNQINPDKLSQTITALGQSSTSFINTRSRKISELTSKLEYVSTHLSEIISLPTPKNNLDAHIPATSDHA